MAVVETRSPLQDTTNSPPSSPTPTLRSRSPSLRHKRTQQNLAANLDSSESAPSVHSSIYDASVQDESRHSEAADADLDAALADWNKPLVPDTGTSAAWENTVIGPDGSSVPATFLLALPRPSEHTPHKLDPIKEQNSLATLQSRHSVASTITPHNRNSTHSRSRSRSPAAPLKRSFSLSDLPPPQEEAKRPRSSLCLSPPPSPLLEPIRPLYLPPPRSPTPPNLPTFGTREAVTYRLPPPSPTSKRSSLRQAIGTPTKEQREWRRQTVGLPRGVVMRGEDGTLVRGQFRGIRSGHLPPQREAHAVMRLPPDRAASLRRRREQERVREQAEREAPWLGSHTGTGAVRTMDLDQGGERREGKGEAIKKAVRKGWRKVKEKVRGESKGRRKTLRRWMVACCFCEEVDEKPVKTQQPAEEVQRTQQSVEEVQAHVILQTRNRNRTTSIGANE